MKACFWEIGWRRFNEDSHRSVQNFILVYILLVLLLLLRSGSSFTISIQLSSLSRTAPPPSRYSSDTPSTTLIIEFLVRHAFALQCRTASDSRRRICLWQRNGRPKWTRGKESCYHSRNKMLPGWARGFSHGGREVSKFALP